MSKSEEHRPEPECCEAEEPRDHPPEYYKMNEERHKHLRALVTTLQGQLKGIHERGQREHGGDIWKKACFPMLGPELVDAFTYYFEHEQRMITWMKYLDKAANALRGDQKGLVPTDGLHLIELVREQIRLELGVESAKEVFPE